MSKDRMDGSLVSNVIFRQGGKMLDLFLDSSKDLITVEIAIVPLASTQLGTITSCSIYPVVWFKSSLKLGQIDFWLVGYAKNRQFGYNLKAKYL